MNLRFVQVRRHQPEWEKALFHEPTILVWSEVVEQELQGIVFQPQDQTAFPRSDIWEREPLICQQRNGMSIEDAYVVSGGAPQFQKRGW